MTIRSLGVCTIASIITTAAQAQLTPDRMYYPVDRPIPMTVKVPDGKPGEVRIALLEPVTAKELNSASAAAGGVNLATLFPDLWEKKDSKVVYAQLIVGDAKVGSAVVIQPMVDRGTASMLMKGKPEVVFSPTKQAYSGIRAWVDKSVVIETTLGNLTFEMRPDQAPNTVVNFMQLVDGGFYTDNTFHRILGQKDYRFIVQTGDPTASRRGAPGFWIDLENSKLPHDFGVLSMARGEEPNTNGSQIMMCLSRQRCMVLDGKYTSFGQLTSGAEVLSAIGDTPCEWVGTGETKEQSKPVEPPRIVKARTVEAPPYGTGPKPVAAPAPAPVNR